MGLQMRVLLLGTLLAGLGACGATVPNQGENLDLISDARRTFVERYQDQPFERGTVHVVAEEHGELHTYSLTPCGEDHICGPNGRQGHVTRMDDHVVVSGAYNGRTFYLSPGGDGFLNWRGVNRDLAWN